MNFIVGGLGFVFHIASFHDLPKLSWQLEPRAVDAISSDIARQMKWPELDLQGRRGAIVSTARVLYDPEHYTQNEIGKIHRDTALSFLGGGSLAGQTLPEPPLEPDIPLPAVYIRVLPLFVYGETPLIAPLIQKELTTEFTARVLFENLNLEPSATVAGYNKVILHNNMRAWRKMVVQNLTHHTSEASNT